MGGGHGGVDLPTPVLVGGSVGPGRLGRVLPRWPCPRLDVIENDGRGVLVTQARGPAQVAGLRMGDVVKYIRCSSATPNVAAFQAGLAPPELPRQPPEVLGNFAVRASG